MTGLSRDDIIRMAREAGIGWLERAEGITEFLEHFANLVAAAEREAIASILDEYDHKVAPSLMAKAIRARGDALTKLNQAAEDNGEKL